MMNNNTGFGSNSGNLYAQYQGMSRDAQRDRLGTAMDYAADNSGDLVNSVMRDDRRNLQENTLTGIDLNASNSGNMNSSRAGVATAVANRGYDDRRADVATNIQNNLIDRSLAQQSQQFDDQGRALQGAGEANRGIASAYTTGLNTLGEGANFGMNAGNSLQGYNQAALTDEQIAFERQRDFEMQQRLGYQQGMLGQAPNSVGAIAANEVNPFEAAIAGGTAGFGFSKQYQDYTGYGDVTKQPGYSNRMSSFGGGGR
jgi:hypothetical protein